MCSPLSRQMAAKVTTILALFNVLIIILTVSSLLFTIAIAKRTGAYDDAVLLAETDTLVFQRGALTSFRRTYAVPQLECVGGSAKGETTLYPVTVMCKNQGGNQGSDVVWKCESELEAPVKLGRTTVSCEGIRDSSDPYVLKGSCGLEYELEYRPGYPKPKMVKPQPITQHVVQESVTTTTITAEPNLVHNTTDTESVFVAILVFSFLFMFFVISKCCEANPESQSSEPPQNNPMPPLIPPAPSFPVIIHQPAPIVIAQPPLVTTTTHVHTITHRAPRDNSDFYHEEVSTPVPALIVPPVEPASHVSASFAVTRNRGVDNSPAPPSPPFDDTSSISESLAGAYRKVFKFTEIFSSGPGSDSDDDDETHTSSSFATTKNR